MRWDEYFRKRSIVDSNKQGLLTIAIPAQAEIFS